MAYAACAIATVLGAKGVKVSEFMPKFRQRHKVMSAEEMRARFMMHMKTFEAQKNVRARKNGP